MASVVIGAAVLPLVPTAARKYNAAMLVFVDKSGDAGMKLGAGSSDLFILTAVLFQDREEARRCDEQFQAIRAALGLPTGYEFHFNSESRKVRMRFLETFVPFDFFSFGVVVEKTRLNKPIRNPAFQFRESIIKYAAGILLETAKPFLKDATVVIDASGSKEFGNQLARYLKTGISDEDARTFIKKVRTTRSRGDNLLQLADMISGTLWQSFVRKDGSYRSVVSAKEASVEVWPK